MELERYVDFSPLGPDAVLGQVAGNTAAFVCEHITADSAPAGSISIDDDGTLQIICTGEDHDFDDPSKIGLTSLTRLISNDPALASLGPVAPLTLFERDAVDRAWERFEIDPSDDGIEQETNG